MLTQTALHSNRIITGLIT